MCCPDDKVIFRQIVSCAKTEICYDMPHLNTYEKMTALIVMSDGSGLLLKLTTKEQISMLDKHHDNLVLELRLGEE